jgi:hypothetical protein
MTIFNSLRKVLLPAIGGVAGLTLGCVITTNGKDCTQCGNNLCRSVQVGNECFCQADHQFKEPNNPNNFECEPIPGKGASTCPDPNSHLDFGQCFCDPGYTWCNPADNDDLSCCFDDGQVVSDGTGGHTSVGTDSADTGDTGLDSDTGDTDGPSCNFDDASPCPAPEFEPDPADCNADAEGFVACSNTLAMGAECSVLWVCDGNDWVEDPQMLHDICVNEGADFAAGCVDDGETVSEVCGLGPGTRCEGDCAECLDDEIIQFCSQGALNQDNCFVICTEFGDEQGITYDHGSCADGFCNCCDLDEEGCGR